MKVINLFGGPGAGKSTTAAGLFFLMKTLGHRVELVTEYAKDLTYEKNWTRLDNQLAVTGEQYARLDRLRGQVDWVVTDTPLFLGAVYGKKSWERAVAIQAFHDFDNVNFIIDRAKPYQPYGRRQSEASARHLDERILHLLDQWHIPADIVPGDEKAHQEIYSLLPILH
jgi:ABC-type oligopeptide transport system ATPase subunit